MYISPYCLLVLVPPIFMKFGIRGHLTDIITCVKFLVDRFRGYGVVTPPKLPFPIDLLRRPYNSVRTAVRHCDVDLPRIVTVAFRQKYIIVEITCPPGYCEKLAWNFNNTAERSNLPNSQQQIELTGVGVNCAVNQSIGLFRNGSQVAK